MNSTVKYIISLIMVLTCVMVIVSGGTYAYWEWTSATDADVVFNTSKGIASYVVYDEGYSYFIGDFQPSSTFCQSINTTLSFYKTSEIEDVGLTATVYMDVNSIEDGISSSNDVYWLITKGDNTVSCSNGLNTAEIINYGTFSGVTSGQTITLTSGLEVKTTEQKFTVWIWIDSNGSNLSSLSGETVDTNIWTQIDMLHSEPDTPEIDSGMIPVVLEDDGTVITVSQSDPDWYSYSDKRWANAILVDSDSRSTYLNTSGVTVNQDDILAYYVWIPRYKYRIWTTGVSATGGEQTIDIVFEDKNASVLTGTKVGEYRTHPAFIWDGTPIAGIWVGKFETSVDISSACYTSPSLDNCNNSQQSVRILPNVSSMRYQNIVYQFETSQKLNVNGNIYGLSLNVDSHMMKNSEWGAVAYLSHSAYGINDEIRINNNSNYITGCGASTKNGSATSSCEITYNSSLTPQSTTGNITGIFDMSGGAWEYVMGVLSDDSGKPLSGKSSYANSGFNGLLYDGTSYTSGVNFPSNTYYDLYNGTSITNSCIGGICFGHALSEIANWYSDNSYFVSADAPWFVRSGGYSAGANAGIFYFNTGTGAGLSGYDSWRSVFIIQ